MHWRSQRPLHVDPYTEPGLNTPFI